MNIQVWPHMHLSKAIDRLFLQLVAAEAFESASEEMLGSVQLCTSGGRPPSLSELLGVDKLCEVPLLTLLIGQRLDSSVRVSSRGSLCARTGVVGPFRGIDHRSRMSCP